MARGLLVLVVIHEGNIIFHRLCESRDAVNKMLYYFVVKSREKILDPQLLEDEEEAIKEFFDIHLDWHYFVFREEIIYHPESAELAVEKALWDRYIQAFRYNTKEG